MAYKSNLLWTGLGTGILGSMIAPPGEKRKGFALGAIAGIGGKALMQNQKIRSKLGLEDLADNFNKKQQNVSSKSSTEQIGFDPNRYSSQTNASLEDIRKQRNAYFSGMKG